MCAKIEKMRLATKFAIYEQKFRSMPPIFTAPLTTQEYHAEKIVEWIDLTENLNELRQFSKRTVEETLTNGLKCVERLLYIGDDISALVGQINIAQAAERFCPGLSAANHLAWAARLSAFSYQLEDAQSFLYRMRRHFKESHHTAAAQYWALKGLVLRLQKKWLEAIPCFQLSLEHLEQCSVAEITHWYSERIDDLISNRNQHIADCWINIGWTCGSMERANHTRNARRILLRNKGNPSLPVERILAQINEIELLLLEDKREEAREGIQIILEHKTTSPRAATMRPAAHCMNARLSAIEGDQIAMVGHLSRALAESTLFPHVLQESVLVDYALELIHSNAISMENMAPLFEAMVVMLEAKDWYTGRGHSKAVADLTIKIWDQLQQDPQEEKFRSDLFWAGYLHDIGKIRLPRSLLNKMAPLGKKEWEIIRKHPSYGREILDTFGAHRVAEWVEEHHQNTLGNGYPGNKPASTMGLCIAVSDIVEAATSRGRKYRPPKTLHEITMELGRNNGGKYPESIIRALEFAVNFNPNA